MDAVKVFEPTDEQIAAVKAQWSKTPTRRTVTKVTKVAKASTPKPTKEGAIWSDKLGGFFPLAWLDSPAVKAADGRPLQQNPLRQFKGQDGCVMTYNGGAWGNGSPIELQYAGKGGKPIKGYITIHAGMTVFNPMEAAPAIDNQPILLKPGMFYRVPAGMAE